MSAGVRVSLSAAQVNAVAGLVDSNHFPPPASAPAQGESTRTDVTRVDSDGMGSATVSAPGDITGMLCPICGADGMPCAWCDGTDHDLGRTFTPAAAVAGWAR